MTGGYVKRADQIRQYGKRRARRMTDRLVRPYVDELKGAQAAAAPQPAPQPLGGVPSQFFLHALHELRTVELEHVPKGAQRALSVGVNGSWYFDWFENAVGPVERHVGIEAFEPMPNDLPDYVEWVPDTADQMAGVADGAVDLVFAGETTEHLWAHELSGFLAEAHRVLAPDGLLVLDSPNRLVTEQLLWSHGGHTVELSADEIIELVQLAGFEVETVRGIWRCRFDDRVLALEEALDNGPLLVRRVTDGPDHVEDSFLWWVNARRRGTPVPREQLDERVREMFAAHWPKRVCRGLPRNPDDPTLAIRPSDHGLIGSTLPFMLHAGSYRLRVETAKGALTSLEGFELQMVAPGGLLVHSLPVAAAQTTETSAEWTFSQADLMFALELKVHVASASDDVELVLPLDIRAIEA